ncbi:hypothetical protein H3T52_08675 [Commensalibacter sp. M0402]|uniref:hypothetical protein n=1 Tax=Commensalibacter TaxID=1079922 RepID=UPI0018DD4CE6|nr:MULTISPECIES: hypothetical protein [Commensalibacter]MBI0083777.1 hypothetical protein [Commensalibacter sp. W6292M3]MBI0089013.1 hypothetical protein [Commensalibacter melissae]
MNFKFFTKPQNIIQFEGFHFSRFQCDQLYEMILVDDEIHLNVSLPDKLVFDYTQDQLIDGFMISRQLWVEGVMEPAFMNILHSLRYSCHLSKENKAVYKKVRAKFKHLCYAYRAFDERHCRPYWLGKMTGLLGKLQDGFKNRKSFIVKPRAVFLDYIWHEKGLYLLKREVNCFFPCNLKSFVKYFRKRLEIIKKELETHVTITAHEFHNMRKTISMIAATYGTFDVLFPSDYHHQTFQYLSTINGMMGDYHDELVEKKLNKIQNYYFDRFMIPEEIKNRLNTFAGRFIDDSNDFC